MKFLVFLLFLLMPLKILSQSGNWKEIQTISVEQNSHLLKMPFAGSFNSAQVESIDLNADGIEDLVVFDRTCQKLSTFLAENSSSANSYIYAPFYEKQLPLIENWFHLIDFDGDLKKDLFCYSAAGIKLYKNVGQGNLNKFVLFQDPLYSEGFSGKINLYVAPSDIPAIGDLDGDGDLDILAFEPAGHFLELHQNFSVEKSGKPDIDYKRTVQGWGNFIHNDCKDIVFGTSFSNGIQTQSVNSAENTLHVGNALSLWNSSKNTSMDLLFGHISCSNLVHLSNTGTGLKPNFELTTYDFPRTNPVNVAAFAYANSVDLNRDGKMDLLVSTNTSDNVNYTQNFQKNLLYFQQVGSELIKQTDGFLQDEMIDVGEKASPVFWDADQDGDLDLLIGNAGIRGEKGVRASIYYYENSGSNSNPTYLFRSKDFMQFSEKNQSTNLRLQTVDWNLDGKKDLVLNFETFVDSQMQVLIAGKQEFVSYNLKNISLGESVYLKDVDQDGILDAFVLSKSGQIQRFQLKETKSYGLEWKLMEPDLFSLSSLKTWSIQSFDFLDDVGDGQLKLMAMDKVGNIHWAEIDWVNHSIIEKPVPAEMAFNYGKNTSIQSFDWNQDGKQDLLLGLGGGGIRLFQNNNSSPILDNKEAIIQIWPNPNQGEFFIRTAEKGQIRIMDFQGKLIYENLNIPALESNRILLNSEIKGVFFVQFTGESRKRGVRKIILE
ncbi:FG-GAP-like repeat-containing protein [Aquirufa sp. ROCK-SH2]